MKYLFGPVPSRRFGRSLGVDLTPYKTCCFDCVFCQLGRTTHKTVERREYVPVQDVLSELDRWLAGGGRADVITLSGSGEPTLHSRFGEVIDFIRKNTDSPAVVLTNGALLHLPEVRAAASRADVVKTSLSAWDQHSFEWVNRPHEQLRFEQVLEGQKTFRTEFSGKLYLEVFAVGGMNAMGSSMGKIAALAEEISPDRIQLNTAVRPPAEDFVEAVSPERLAALCPLFHPPAEVIAEFDEKIDSKIQVNTEALLSMLRRRPCTSEQIAKGFGMHANEVSKYLGSLLRTGRIRAIRKNGSVYYAMAAKKSAARDSA
ncbi:MAG: radical SAM protein [Desulfobacterales bacterium]|nr:radical SAM protein [Desulfobacterales bacterium]